MRCIPLLPTPQEPVSASSERHEIRDAIMVTARQYAVLKHERTQQSGLNLEI